MLYAAFLFLVASLVRLEKCSKYSTRSRRGATCSNLLFPK